jgi:type II secretory pathway component PulF
LIWVTAAFHLTDIHGQPLDMLGLGLRGTSGLAILMGVVVAAMLAVMWLIEAGRRGAAGTRSLLAWATRIPLVGEPLATLAIAQFTWALQLVIDTPMDLRQALPLALDATGNDHYSRLGPQVARRVEQGATIQEALAETGAFPSDVLEAIRVGEQTGMLAETMQRLARDYQERAAAALAILAQAIGYFIWALVGVLIIVLIFRLFNMYLDPIRELSDPNFRL